MQTKATSLLVDFRRVYRALPFHKIINIDKFAIIIIIFIGIFLRVQQYLFNRSLWIDEAFLALNIINRSFSELLLPLDYVQGAPILFLFIERLAVQIFGNNEYALRLFPLLSGIISLIIFSQVLMQFVNKLAAILGTFLFSTSSFLIYYSSEVKQYSSDVAISVLLYFFYIIFFKKDKFSINGILLFNMMCCILIWISHPSVFVMAGIFASISIRLIIQERWKDAASFLAPSLVVLLSFYIFYLLSLHDLINHPSFSRWNRAFLSIFSFSFVDFIQVSKNFLLLFHKPLGFSLIGIAFLAFLMGVLSLIHRERETFFVLFSPIIFVILASSLHLYPFIGRLLMFLVPSLLIFIAEGSYRIFQIVRKDSYVFIIVFLLLLLVPPTLNAAKSIIEPQVKEEIKQVLSFIKENKSNKDIIYIYYSAYPAFKFYKDTYGLSDNAYVIGVSARHDWKCYIRDLDKLRGKERVWFIFSHVYKNGGIDEKILFLYHLNHIGKQIVSFESQGASVYLYDLASPTKLSVHLE